MKLAIGNSRMDKVWRNREMTWEEFCARVSVTIRTTESVSEYRASRKGAQEKAKDVGGFVGGWLKEGRRRNGNVICRSMLTLDMDYATPDVWSDLCERTGYTCCIYSTHKHTPDKPRLRLIIPLAREISEDEYPAVGRMVAKEVGIDMFDDTTYEAARLMYWPSTPRDGEFVFQRRDGDLLDPDAYLSQYNDWRDVSTWPTSVRQSDIERRAVREQADPLQKEGIVGTFCRAYSIEEAIDTFLTDVYSASAMEGRYDYVPADSIAGVVVYGHKFAYSHHATDPACGKLLNAYDLVRFHRYRDLDDGCDPDVISCNLPSYRAMRDFALMQDAVKRLLAEERMEAASREFTDADIDWQSSLALDKQGGIKDTATNIAAIIRHDPLLQSIVYNELKYMLDVTGELPWTQVKPGWGEADVANAKLYLDRMYGLWSPIKFKDALLAVASAERIYNPVKDYLNALVWDGVPRLDSLLVDYIGAEDTEYVRAVTRKTLCAAVARIFEPGVKFDSVLVLNGPQGLGKSMLYARLGMRWYSDSLQISDMKDKAAAEKLQGYWIMELGEMAGMRKVDVETIKSFITRVDDMYRQAYASSVESHPRTNIIVGTSNSDTGFLRDITGNRRFWPVRVVGRGSHYPWELEREAIDQIWAEATRRYQEGETLYLTGELARAATLEQRDAMEADEREGLVADYLDRLLPANWSDMELYERRNYLYGSEMGSVHTPGTVRRTMVCPMEIWCECFGKERATMQRQNSYEIAGIMYRIGGWKRYEGSKDGKERFSLYGKQISYVRSEGVSHETL